MKIKLATVIIGISFLLGSCSQGRKSKSTKTSYEPTNQIGTLNEFPNQTIFTHDPESYIHTELKHLDTAGKPVIIQNSYPKGGGQLELGGLIGYTDNQGIDYGHGIFWTRIINKTENQVKLSIEFPSDSLAIPNSPGSYFRLFLPPGKMTFDKIPMYNFGITGLKLFLDANFHKPSTLQTTINPGEEHIFYVSILMHVPNNGPVRTRLFSKGQNLYYETDIAPHGSVEIPCGQISFKK